MTQNEDLAKTLEATGDYKILRRLQTGPRKLLHDAGPVRRVLVLDLETTGLDPAGLGGPADEVIECAAVPVDVTSEGRIAELHPAFCRLREPAKPISEQITRLTGLTPEMVAGHVIDPDDLAALLQGVDLVIAHNAKFDRPFAERLHQGFAGVPWACSMTQVPWSEHGFEGLRLSYLLASVGLFHEGHRGEADCYALAELLSRELGSSGETAMSALLAAARRPLIRVWADGAPFEKKDLLRQRAYRWSAGEGGRPRAWYRDILEEDVADEKAWLQAMVMPPGRQPMLIRCDARDRFSERA